MWAAQDGREVKETGDLENVTSEFIISGVTDLCEINLERKMSCHADAHPKSLPSWRARNVQSPGKQDQADLQESSL